MAKKINIIDVKDSNGNSTGKQWIENLDTANNISANKNIPKEGAALYKGHFTTGESVAIKIYTNRDTDKESGYTSCFKRAQNNLEFLSLLGNEHPNLIVYFGHHEIKEVPQGHKKIKIFPKTFLFTELCTCSVRELVITEEMQKKILTVLPRKKILEQSAMAVNFIHGLGLVHRNLHPNNFLIQQMGTTYTVKLTDFQLAKDWEKYRGESYRHPMTGWRAVPECDPELQITDKKERDSKSDVYTLGCYFYFVLSGGNHPFGGEDPNDKEIFDPKSKPYLEHWSPDVGNFVMNITTLEERGKAVNLIWNMIRFCPTDRKSMWEVLDSDYFQKEPSHYQIYDDPEKRKPGLCVIICQEKFHDPGDNMDGMGRNCAQLRRTFFRFGYEVLVYQNIEANEIINVLKPEKLAKTVSKDSSESDNLAKDSKENCLSKYASLVVCILSHGGITKKGEECVFGVDGASVETEPVIREFNNYNCKELAGKPKIFIIFSCRGENSQIVMQNDPALSVSSQSSAEKQDDVTVYGNDDTKSAMEDFLILRSTIKEFYSYYVPGKGAAFIEHLCGALISEYNVADLQLLKEKKKDLVSLYHSYVVPLIGREVLDLRSPDGSTVRQTPESRSTLTKTIRFLPKVSTSDIASRMTAEKENSVVKLNGVGTLHFWEQKK